MALHSVLAVVAAQTVLLGGNLGANGQLNECHNKNVPHCWISTYGRCMVSTAS